MAHNHLMPGPNAQSHADRQAILQNLVEQIITLYADQIRLIALYGSMARQQDGPFSDIELFCVLDASDLDTTYEWVYGNGKAEINVYGLEVARQQARRVEAEWALEKGQFLRAVHLAGDWDLLDELKRLSVEITDQEIQAEILSITVGELYEWIGKLRNMDPISPHPALVLLACKFCEMIALVVGLANRTIYTTGLGMLAESLALPDLPQGYTHLCQLVISGELNDPVQIRQALEESWLGVIAWEASKGIEFSSGRSQFPPE